MAAAVAALVLSATGCGGGDGEASGSVDGETTDRSSVPAPPTCEDGEAGRRFVLCTAGDTPDQQLVVALHGRGSSAAEMQAVTELDRHAATTGLASFRRQFTRLTGTTPCAYRQTFKGDLTAAIRRPTLDRAREG